MSAPYWRMPKVCPVAACGLGRQDGEARDQPWEGLKAEIRVDA